LALTFVIYLPISYFRNDVFLIALDIILLIAVFISTYYHVLMHDAFPNRELLFLLVVIYVSSIVLCFASDVLTVKYDIRMLINLRNWLFGIGIFFVSSLWLNTQHRIDTVINILLWGSLFTAIYGIRQLLFGFAEFELDRISIMGSSLGEMETLGRIRITSTFGDPLTCSFFMMIGVLVYFLARSRNLSPVITNKFHPFVLIIIFITLVLTLTRAPLLGLICGGVLFAIFNFEMTREKLVSYAKYLSCLCLGSFGLYSFATSSVFVNSDNPILLSISNGSASAFTLFQMILGVDDPELFFLVNQSKESRTNSWYEGISFLISNPSGGGLSNTSNYNFSLGDVGILKLGLQSGIIAMIAMLCILMLVGIQAWNEVRRFSEPCARWEGYLLISIWLSIIVTEGITSLLDSSVISIVIWVIAGVLVNVKFVFNNQSSAKC
jgi:hypothetical protein